jgi:hypothetical protein
MAIMSYGSVARRASAIGAWCPLPGSPAFETLPCSDSVLKTVHDAIERCLYPLLSAALASGDAGGLMHLALYHQEPMKFVSER